MMQVGMGLGQVHLMQVAAIENGFLVTYKSLYRAEVKNNPPVVPSQGMEDPRVVPRLPVGELGGIDSGGKVETRTELLDRTVFCKTSEEVGEVANKALTEFGKEIVDYIRRSGISYGGQYMGSVGG